jgi:hypothetical protein
MLEILFFPTWKKFEYFRSMLSQVSVKHNDDLWVNYVKPTNTCRLSAVVKIIIVQLYTDLRLVVHSEKRR